MRWSRILAALFLLPLLFLLPSLAAADVCDDTGHIKTLSNQWDDWANMDGDEGRAELTESTRKLAQALEEEGETELGAQITELLDELAEETDGEVRNDLATEIQESLVEVFQFCSGS